MGLVVTLRQMCVFAAPAFPLLHDFCHNATLTPAVLEVHYTYVCKKVGVIAVLMLCYFIA